MGRNPPVERHHGTISLAPRIYEGGGPRSGRGSPPAAAAGKASSVTASPCQLPQRGSRGRFAPFLPPAFMRGRATQWRGESLRSGESLLSHGFAVPAPPEGKPRALRTVPAPRIYEGGGPRSGGGSPPPQRGRPSQSRFACRLSRRESQGAVVVPRSHSTGGFPRQCAHSLGMTGNREPAWNDRLPADCFRTASPPTSRSPGLAFSGGLWYNAECIFLI